MPETADQSKGATRSRNVYQATKKQEYQQSFCWYLLIFGIWSAGWISQVERELLGRHTRKPWNRTKWCHWQRKHTWNQFWPVSDNLSRRPFSDDHWITRKTRDCYTLWMISRKLASHQQFEKVKQVNVSKAQQPGLTSSSIDTSGLCLACAEDRQHRDGWGHGQSLLHQPFLPHPTSWAGQPWAGIMHLPRRKSQFLLGITGSKRRALLGNSTRCRLPLLDCCFSMTEDCWIIWELTSDSAPLLVYPSHKYRDEDE